MNSVLRQHLSQQIVHVARCDHGHGETPDNAALAHLPAKVRQFHPRYKAQASARGLKAHAGDEQTRHADRFRQGGFGLSIKGALQ